MWKKFWYIALLRNFTNFSMDVWCLLPSRRIIWPCFGVNTRVANNNSFLRCNFDATLISKSITGYSWNHLFMYQCYILHIARSICTSTVVRNCKGFVRLNTNLKVITLDGHYPWQTTRVMTQEQVNKRNQKMHWDLFHCFCNMNETMMIITKMCGGQEIMIYIMMITFLHSSTEGGLRVAYCKKCINVEDNVPTTKDEHDL